MRKLLCLFVLLAVNSSFASDEEQLSGEGPCKTDREKFCKEVKPGEGRIVQCMKEKKDQLSAECKAKIEEKKEKVKEAQELCATDKEKFCKDMVKPRKIMKCLKKNENQLSQQCRDALPQKAGKHGRGEHHHKDKE